MLSNFLDVVKFLSLVPKRVRDRVRSVNSGKSFLVVYIVKVAFLGLCLLFIAQIQSYTLTLVPF